VQCKRVPPRYYTSGLEAQHWWQTGWDGIYPRPDGAFWKRLTYDRAQAHGHIHVNVSMPLCQTVGSQVGRPTATFKVAVSMHEGQAGDTINGVGAKVYSGSSAHQTHIGLNNFANRRCTSFDATATATARRRSR
jgi:hypothetical protein